MKRSSLKRQLAVLAIVALGFSACKKEEFQTPQPSGDETSQVVAHAAAGATYYVSTTGSDAGTGSSTSPWKTLAKATSAVTAAGSIIHVNAGTYTETVKSNLAKAVSI